MLIIVYEIQDLIVQNFLGLGDVMAIVDKIKLVIQIVK